MTTFQCPGFVAGAIEAGIKYPNRKDVGLLFSIVPAHAAGVFTTNRIKAAPVLLDMELIRNGKARAVIVNSGNANCFTGEQGEKDAIMTCRATANALQIPWEEVLVSSTGVIGNPMPMDVLLPAIPKLVANLKKDGFMDLAQAMMTTDIVPKVVQKTIILQNIPVTLVGVAKGAGMIRPDMATMLSYIVTDAYIPPTLLKKMLLKVVNQTYNRITIDGDTSTNDTVFLLANGVSNVSIRTGSLEEKQFQFALYELCQELSHMLIKDGEGATKVVELIVKGTATQKDAQKIAETIAHSPLVKTAFFGEDANWGRIIAAAGRLHVLFDPQKIDLFFDDIAVIQQGRFLGKEVESAATQVLKTNEFTVTLDFHMGSCGYGMLTCDFSVEYVKINADYRT